MARGGKPRVYIDGDASGVAKATRQAEASLKRLDRAGSRSLSGISKHARGLNPHLAGIAAGFTSVAGAAALLTDSVKQTEDLAKGTAMIARTTGESTREASRWVAVAKVRGLEVTRLNRSFVSLAKSIEGANAGSEKQAKLFKDLGVSQQELKKGDVSQILGDVADAFARMPDGAKKAADAQVLFGRGAASLLPLLNRGNQALREQLGLSDKYGTTLSKGQLQAALKAAQAQRELNLAMLGLKVQLGQAVIPALTTGITKLTTFVAQMRSGEGAGGKFAAKLRDMWNGAKPVVKSLGDIVTSVGKFIGQHPGLMKVVGGMAALGLAVKSVTFASQISGIGRLLGLVAKLGGAGAKGGLSLADGILSGFSPRWAAKKGAITSAIRRTGASAGTAAGESAAGNLASRMGGTIGGKLKTLAGPAVAAAGTALGAALAGAMFAKILDEIGNWTFHVIGGRDVPNEARSPNSPQPDDPTGVKGALKALGIDVGREGGFMRGGKFRKYRAGGSVPALVSSGEAIVEPDGGVWRVPGRPVAADNVPAMLTPGAAVLTWDGQARMMAGQSLGQAVSMQAPHFQSGGYAFKREPVGYGNHTHAGHGLAVPRSSTHGRSLGRFLTTAYGPPWDAIEGGGITSTGVKLSQGVQKFVVAVDPSVIPQHTPLNVWPNPFGDRGRVFWSEDVGGAIRGKHIDIFHAAADGTKDRWNKHASVWLAGRETTGGASAARGAGAGSRTTTRVSYAAPSLRPGSGRTSRDVFDAAFERGISDPFGLAGRGVSRDLLGVSGLTSTRTVTRTTSPATPRTTPAPVPGGKGFYARVAAMRGLGNWEGWKVAKWIIPELKWARQHGWRGQITSGYRSHAQNVARGRYYHSRHEDTGPYPYGAIDFGSPSDASGKLNFLRYVRGYPGPRLHSLPGDAGHMSGDGHRRGGWIGFRAGGMVSRVPGGSSRLPNGKGGPLAFSTPLEALYPVTAGIMRLGIANTGLSGLLGRARKVVQGMAYPTLGSAAAYIKSLYGVIKGPPKTIQTVRARLDRVLGFVDDQIGFKLGQPVGVSDSVQESIAGAEGRLPNQLILEGIDPDSAAGRARRIGLDTSSIGRLTARRGKLVEARRRALKAGRRDVAKRIGDEITQVDDQVLGLRAEIKQLGETVSDNTDAQQEANAQLQAQNDLLKQQVANTTKALNVSQSQYGVLAKAITDVVSGQIGGRVGLGFQSPSTAGKVARY